MDLENSYHFGVINRALRIIEQHQSDELSLENLAFEMNMSQGHLQKLFSKWVGVSPKRYQQFLSLVHARKLLQNNFNTGETANLLGFSGKSKLHDLFVTWEAMSPGDYAKKGEGLDLYYEWYPSLFGEMLAMGTNKGLCGIALSSVMGREEALRDLCSRWPKANFRQGSNYIDHLVLPLISLQGSTKALVSGAPFQIKVWEALIAIPEGKVTTYSELANLIGAPKSSRAVGNAVGRNPLSWIIPCHRVIRKDGFLGGYHWGLPIKKTLLALEVGWNQPSETTDDFSLGL